jgi:hypothetical protein
MKNNIVRVSLVIPVKNQILELNYLCNLIQKWKLYPKEIIIILTGKKFNINSNFLNFCIKKNILLRLFKKPGFFPGAARNFGIKASKYNILTFLDVKTIPSNKWFLKSYQKIISKNYDIVWGHTIYLSNTNKEKIIKISTYGINKLKTFVGSFVKKKVFYKYGFFLDNIRAGEDPEWIYNVDIHQLKVTSINQSLSYIGLINMSYNDILKKWFRNYSYSYNLSYLYNKRNIYISSIFFFLILIAFNWNNLFINWRLSDPLQFPYVTKISFLLFFLCYFFYRGIILPLKKGASYSDLLPFNFIFIIIFSFFIDVTKISAFVFSKFKRRY